MAWRKIVKTKKNTVPQCVKEKISAVRKARIAAGMCNDQRFHERCVRKDRRQIRDRDLKRDMCG